jgi:hypothetical protein
MYISNIKELTIPYLVIIYWLVFAGPPATTSIGSIQKAKNVTPSIIEPQKDVPAVRRQTG